MTSLEEHVSFRSYLNGKFSEWGLTRLRIDLIGNWQDWELQWLKAYKNKNLSDWGFTRPQAYLISKHPGGIFNHPFSLPEVYQQFAFMGSFFKQSLFRIRRQRTACICRNRNLPGFIPCKVQCSFSNNCKRWLSGSSGGRGGRLAHPLSAGSPLCAFFLYSPTLARRLLMLFFYRPLHHAKQPLGQGFLISWSEITRTVLELCPADRRGQFGSHGSSHPFTECGLIKGQQKEMDLWVLLLYEASSGKVEIRSHSN